MNNKSVISYRYPVIGFMTGYRSLITDYLYFVNNGEKR